MTIKTVGQSVSSNWMGAILGAGALYLVAKKALKIENKYAVIGLGVIGLIGGAMVQSKLKSKATIKPAIVGQP